MTDFPIKIDLHCHTTASDGRLTPDELIARAVENGVSILSITDHDTVDAYSQITTVPEELTLITGCEFSTRIGKQEIHMVGLHFDRTHPDIIKLLAWQKQARLIRAKTICTKLQKIGIEIDLDLVRTQNNLDDNNTLTSPHIAKTLLNLGIITQPQQAYKRYFGVGKKAFVRTDWEPVEKIINTVHAAGGIALLAHPLGYNLTRTKRMKYIYQFIEVGGDGFEVFCGKQGMSNTSELITLCKRLGLITSVGSDFHAPYPYRHDLGVNLTQLEKSHPEIIHLKKSWNHSKS